MSHIFISYSHDDWGYADSLATTLRGLGFDVWIDQRINPGDEWPKAIQNNLAQAGAVVVIMSPSANASAWVAKEVDFSLKSGKPIFPLLLEGKALLPSLRHMQYEDVTHYMMPDKAFYEALWKILPAERQIKKTDSQAVERIADYLGRIAVTGMFDIVDWDTLARASVFPEKNNRVSVTFSLMRAIESEVPIMEKAYRKRDFIESIGWEIDDEFEDMMDIRVERVLQNRGDEENLARDIIAIFRRIYNVNAAVLEIEWLAGS